MSEPYPSATVMLLRDSDAGLQSLLLRRHDQLRTGAGAWVFPGGRVDAGDFRDSRDHFAAARHAAVRETLEETGLTIEAGRLHAFAHWTTPPGRQRRFATWFFIARAPQHGEVVVDGGEIVDHRWLRPQDALDAQRAGDITLMPPTFVSLTLLAQYSDCAAALAGFAEREVQHFNPLILKTDRGQVILYDDDAGYACGDVERPGRRHRISICGNDWRYECG